MTIEKYQNWDIEQQTLYAYWVRTMVFNEWGKWSIFEYKKWAKIYGNDWRGIIKYAILGGMI